MVSDRKLLYAAIVAVLSLALIAAFHSPAFSDSDYGVLLSSGISAGSIDAMNLALLATLPLAVYLVSAYALRNDEFHSLLAALLFAFSGASTSSLFSVSPVLGAFLGQSFSLAAGAKLAGTLLPFGLVALLGYKKDAVSAALALLGALLIPFAPGVSAILLALSSAQGIRIVESEPYGDKALVLASFLFCMQGFYSGDALAAAVSALFIAALFYVAISLHNVKPSEVYALALLFVAFGALTSFYSITQARAQSLSSSELALFASLGQSQGAYGVLDYPKAFQYLSGKEPVLLNSTQLLKKNASLPDSIIFSRRAFTKAYSGSPIFFTYYATGSDASGGEVALFTSSYYGLYMRVSQSELAPEDAQLIDLRTGEGAMVPFTRIRQLAQLPYKDASNLMVNVQDISETPLYDLLFRSGASFGANATVIKVR